jgi:membrane protein implicated in regulation of membrane protease activity
MGKITSVIIVALIAGAYATLSAGVEIFLIVFFIALLIFWAVVKPLKEEKQEKKITEKDLQDLKEELEEKIKS